MGLIDGLFSGLLGTVGSIMQNDSNQSFAASQSLAQQNWQERMFWNQVNVNKEVFANQNTEWRRRLKIADQYSKDMQDWLYEKYNNPSAIASAMRKAGINPSVAFGNGQSPFGSMSTPASFSAGEPTMNSATPGNVSLPSYHGENVLGGLSQGIASLSQIAKNYSEAGRSDMQSLEISRMLDEKVRGLLLRNNYQEIDNDRTAFLFSLDKMNLPQKQEAEIKDLVNSASLKLALGKGAEAKADLDAANTKLAEQKFDINEPYAQNAMLCFRLYTDSMEQSIKLGKAQTFSSYQQGLLSKAIAKTENDMRIGKLTLQEYDNQLREIDVRHSERVDFNEMITNNARLVAMFHQFEREGLVNKDMVISLERAAYSNDRKEVEWWIDQSVKALGAIGSAVQTGTGVYNARTNRLNQLNGKERNAIYQSFVDGYNQHNNTPHVIEHEMYDSFNDEYVPVWRETR